MHIAVLDTGNGGGADVVRASSLGNAQARLVLVMLAVESPRLVRSDELADALWADRLPKTWDTMVRGAVAKVRRRLADAGLDPLAAVQSGDGGYRLVLPLDWSVDVHVARRSLAAAEAAATAGDARGAARAADHAAVTVVGRDLLPEMDGDWLRGARRNLHVLGTDALQIGASSELSLGNHRRAVALARQLIALEPFGEPSYQVLMRALAAVGDRARALQAYDGLESLLRLELGVAPSIETESVHRALRDTSSAASTITPIDRADRAAAGLIGRADERARLMAAWERASTGRLAVALVSGEAGIGKTTLVLHAAHQAWADGADVLIGRCSPHPATAYEPMVEAIAAHAESSDATTRERLLDAAGPALGWVVPSLGHLLGDATPSSDPDRDRLRLFDAVTSYIGAVSADVPTMLILDDVQWASSTTWSLLGHLVRRLAHAPLLVVMTERRPDVADPRLGEMLTAWRRDPGIEEIGLVGWTAAEAATFIATTRPPESDVDHDATLAESLHLRTGGNPYFITELLRATTSGSAAPVGGRDEIPRGIVDIVDHHAASSGADATSVMQALAVVGSDAGSQLLRRVAGLDADRFLDALDAALGTGLVRERAGRLDFAHALARDAVSVGIPTGHRLRLHGRIADEMEALRDRGAAVSSSDLAHHFASALGRADRAAVHSIDAARADLAAGARDEATERLRRALDLDPSDRLRCDVLILLGTTLAQQGDGADSQRAFLEAASIATKLADGHSLAVAAIGLTTPGRGVTTWVADRSRVDLLESALAALGAGDDALRVRLLGALSDSIVGPDSWAHRQRLAEDAVAIAARSTDPAAVTAALGATRIAWWRPDQTEARLAAADRVFDIAISRGDDETAAAAAIVRIADLIVIGDRERVDVGVATARPVVERVGMVRFGWALGLIEAGLALADGHLAEAEAAAQQAFAVWGSDDQPDAMRAFTEQVGFAILSAGDAQRVDENLELYLQSVQSVGAYRCLLPILLLLLDRLDEARREIELIAADAYRIVPAHSSWLFAITALADAAAVIGSAEVVEHLRAELTPHAGRMVHLEGPSITWGCVDHRLGTLAFAAGDLTDAEVLLRRALVQHESFGTRHWAWRTSVALAGVLRAMADSNAADEADRRLRTAMAEAEAMGLPHLQRQVAALL